jgi:hypothetical protein
MTLYARIEQDAQGIYTISLIGWSGIVAQGASEAEALRALREIVMARLAGAKVVPFDLGAERPWLQTAGMFRDDPFAEEFDAVLTNYRREIDAADYAAPSRDHAA